MEVIQFHDATGDTMVARVPPSGTSAIRLGSQLIVEESQQAVFFRDGKALDTFGPGRHTLATQNIPILASVFGIPFGGTSPFQAAVVFVSTQTFMDLKWGTKEPVVYRDKELAMVRLRAFGKFAVRVTNAQLFVNSVVGTRGVYSTEGVESYFKDVIVARLTDLLGPNAEELCIRIEGTKNAHDFQVAVHKAEIALREFSGSAVAAQFTADMEAHRPA